MDKTSFFEFNQPEYSDAVDVGKLNENMDKIDQALFAGLCKKKVTGNSIGDGTQVGSPKGWAPFFEIKNTNETEVVVTNRNFEGVTYTIPAGETHREYISGLYPMNFIAADDKEVEYSYFVDAETRISEIQPSGGGGVTSVTVNTQNNSHLTTSGSPIVDSGTITIGVSSGYEIPETSKQTEWNGKAVDLKAEINSSTYVMTLQLKDSSGNLIGSEKTIDLPLETMVVDGEYDSQTKKIKLELKNGNYVEFSVADLVSGLQSELNSNNKLNPAYINYDSTHRAVTDTEKSTWNSKENALSSDSAAYKSNTYFHRTAAGQGTKTSGSLNDITASGTLYCSSGVTNGPVSSSAMMVETMILDSTTALQKATLFTGSNVNDVYYREKRNSSWQSWCRMGSPEYTKSPSGNVSSASLDLSDLPTGGYLMYVVNNESGTNRYGCSVYTLGKYDSGTLYVCTPVYEKTNSKMSSYTFSSDVMDITFDKSGYKTIKFVRQY